MLASPDPRRCPLCRGANGCAREEGKNECWCDGVQIPREVLDRVPEAAQRKACICEACATAQPAARKLRVASSSGDD